MSPTKPPPRITAWSYSRETDYEGCPAKCKFKSIDKLPEPKSDSMTEGSCIHMLCQSYTTGAVGKLFDEIAEYAAEFESAAKGKLPSELECFAEEFKALRKIKKKLMVEQELAFTRTWDPTEWFAMHGPDAAWCRIKMDLLYQDSPTTAQMVDYKTGKVDAKHKDQLSLYAIGAFLSLPATVTRVDCSLWFLKHGDVMSQAYSRDQLPALIKTWEKRVAKMLKDTSFKPTPGNSCRWCPYSKEKGGPCKF